MTPKKAKFLHTKNYKHGFYKLITIILKCIKERMHKLRNEKCNDYLQ